MLAAFACLVMYALCASPSTAFERREYPDGTPVLDDAGQMILEQTWRTKHGDAMPFLLMLSVSVIFFALAMRALVKQCPDDPEDVRGIDGGNVE